ncbi:unnamed protein product [Ambrosiozyma monospora]|uniref:Unnamed protein product n=1 Tax=Ambrosiozyma monospora TaxID=43982 RepID=A0ACB5UD52_AMBMO|nr:unnamed protein product [Ambrosiozyma monospora]
MTRDGIPGSNICRSSCSLFADTKNQLLYLKKTGNPEKQQVHNHSLQCCLAKTGVLGTDVDEEAWLKQEEEYEAGFKKANIAELSENVTEDESMENEYDDTDDKREGDNDENIAYLADSSPNLGDEDDDSDTEIPPMPEVPVTLYYTP